MAALGAQSIASSYEQLLHVDRDGGGNSTTHVSVKDGDNGTTFGFTIATDALMMSSTNRLEFGDTGTYIHQSADGVLDLVSDTEIEINATTIDMNGALDLSGNAQLSGTVTVGADGSGADVIFYSGTAGDSFAWDASEEKLTITGTNGQTALDVADGNLVVADNIDLEGDIDVNGTANLDNTDIDGTLAVDGTTISLDATTSLNIDNSNTSNGITIGTATSGVPISIGHSTSETTVNDNLVVTGDIDLAGSIDVDGTANLDAVDIDGAVQIDNTVTVGADDQGYDVIFYGDTASSNMTWDTSADNLVLNDSQLFINQDDNSMSINIDSEATTEPVIQVDSPASTTHPIINLTNLDSLTTGEGLRVHSNSSNTSSRKLVQVINDHASATGTTVLNIQQDAGCEAVVIDQNANSNALSIDAENTTTPAVNIVCDALTSGEALRVYSNTGDSSNRNLVEIINDHADADNTRAMYIQNDGALYGIEMAGGCGIRFDNTVASTDAHTLDDYEEGIHTTAITGGTSGSFTLESSNQSLAYTKIGRMVTVQGKFQTSSGSGSGDLRISMPFTSNNSLDDSADVSAGSITVNRYGSTSIATQITPIIFANTAYVLIQIHNTGNANETYLQADNVDATIEGQICISYIV